jgi:hypothetical protein
MKLSKRQKEELLVKGFILLIGTAFAVWISTKL